MPRPTLPTPGPNDIWGAQTNAAIFGLSDSIDLIKNSLTSIETRLTTLGAGSGNPILLVLAATPGNGTLVLSWGAVSGASNIIVRRDGVDAFGNLGEDVVLPGTTTSYRFENLVNGTTYTLTAKAAPNGVEASITGTPTAPTTAQTLVTATVPAEEGVILVTWTPVAGATGYLVERDGPDAVGGGDGWSIVDPPSATNRRFLSLVPGRQYTVAVTPQPSVADGGTFTRQTATATPKAATVVAGQTAVTVGTVTATTIPITWTAVSGATGYRVGRVSLQDPTDVYETVDPSTARTRTFDNLTTGEPYSVYVVPEPGGVKVAKTATPIGTVTTPPAGSGSGTRWLSGMCGPSFGELRSGALSNFRGETVRAYRRWLAPLSNMQMAGYYLNDITNNNGYTETLDYAIGGPMGGYTWASAASGAMDNFWADQMRQIHANWGGLKLMQLSMAHEINGNWYEWAAGGRGAGPVQPGSANANNLIAAWRRFYNIVGNELKAKGRNVKVAMNYACGSLGVNAIYPGDAYIDVIAFDIYDAWKPTASKNIRTQAEWDAYINLTGTNGGQTDPMGPGSYRAMALAKGKPFSVPEWGLADQIAQNYDNPFWIQKMYDFFAASAPADPYNPGPGKLLMDVVFSDSAFPSTIFYQDNSHPQTRAKYIELVWGGAGW